MVLRPLILCCLLVLGWGGPLARAVDQPARHVRQLHTKGEEEAIVRVRDPKVLVADYPLIRKDFPQTRKLSDEAIDRWLIENAAYISKSQLGQVEVNTEIPVVEGAEAKAFRPEGYGRAWVKEMPGGGLMDVKGVGALAPTQSSHANGVATVGELLREYLFEKLVAKALRAGKSPVTTAGTYAVMDYGFDVRHENGDLSPAGAIFRQADARLGHQTTADPARAVDTENVLRRFGITTAGDARTNYYEALNVQTTERGDLVDFGAYLVVDKFEQPGRAYLGNKRNRELFSVVAPKPGIKLVTILDPSDPNFVQPDPALRAPLDVWGPANPDHVDPKADRIWNRMHDRATQLRFHQTDVPSLRAEIAGLLADIDHRFAAAGEPPARPALARGFMRKILGMYRKGMLLPEEATKAIEVLGKDVLPLAEEVESLRKLAGPDMPPRMAGQAQQALYRLVNEAWAKQKEFPWAEFRQEQKQKDFFRMRNAYVGLANYVVENPRVMNDPKLRRLFGENLALGFLEVDPLGESVLGGAFLKHVKLEAPVREALNRPRFIRGLEKRRRVLSATMPGVLENLNELGVGADQKVLLGWAARFLEGNDHDAAVAATKLLYRAGQLPRPVERRLLRLVEKLAPYPQYGNTPSQLSLALLVLGDGGASPQGAASLERLMARYPWLRGGLSTGGIAEPHGGPRTCPNGFAAFSRRLRVGS